MAAYILIIIFYYFFCLTLSPQTSEDVYLLTYLFLQHYELV